jgi:ribosomal protein L16 Arg81 hydroxylase
MLLNKKNIESIKKQKVTFIKNFTTILNTYDFNKISSLVDDYSLDVEKKFHYGLEYNAVWQLKNVDKIDNTFFMYKDFFNKTFKYVPDIKDGVDIFFSFVTNIGTSHVDIEDVFLLGLHGKTTYRMIDTDKDYMIERGDLLYINKGIRHKSMSTTPRSIASIGFYGGKNIV